MEKLYSLERVHSKAFENKKITEVKLQFKFCKIWKAFVWYGNKILFWEFLYYLNICISEVVKILGKRGLYNFDQVKMPIQQKG